MSRILVFFHSNTCGHSRRMDSIVDHFMRQHRGHMKLAKVEMNERRDLAERFGATTAPTLILLDDLVEQARLEGRHTLPTMKQAFEPHLGLETDVPIELAGAC